MRFAIRTALVLAVLVGAAGVSVAQSNEVLDAVLEQDELRTAEAVYLVRVASGAAAEDVSVQEAYRNAAWSAWKIEQKPADAPISLGEFSYLVMEELEMSGGIMYRLIPGPRYAARELAYLGYVDGNRSPYRTLSGNEGLRILGAAVRGD